MLNSFILFFLANGKPSNEYPYVLSLPNPFGFNQHDIDSCSSGKPSNEYPYVLSLPNPFVFNQHDTDSCSSEKPSNEYPYVLSLSNPFGFNQHDIDSCSRFISNSVPDQTLTVDQNLPFEGDIANPNNRIVVPSKGFSRTRNPRV
uniref:Uncharacterized protein n=1 Tax=Solanum lycopersicum TaxID=4081 RepID=A0A3Q7EY34_SOLLC